MFEIEPYGDQGLRIILGDTIAKDTNERIRSLKWVLEQEKIPGIEEWIPTYTAVSIVYDPFEITYEQLRERILPLKEKIENVTLPPARIFQIPVLYGGKVGPDLEHVAAYHNMEIEEVIRTHTATDYLIYMMGFSPGFPYLGGMSEKIATPRLTTPRMKIPVGSVGIAGPQTGVYSVESPGGWHIIGRTPVKLYDPSRVDPILLQAGDYVRFVQITEEAYKEIEEIVNIGDFEVTTVPYKGE